MATTVDTLLVRIEADTSDLKRKLGRMEKDVNKSTKQVSRSFKLMGTAVKGFIALQFTRQLAQGGMAAINLASHVEEMQAKSSVVFGKFRDGVVADLAAFGDAVGRSSHELEEMASQIQDTFVPLGFARGEAAKLSTELTKLAVDTASFNNASDVDTMRAFQSALVGNHEAVRRFGIVITEAEIKQELFRMGITKSVNEITAQEKVQARLRLITAGVSDAQGDAMRTADSFANRTKKLRAEFETFQLKLANDFLPTANKLVTVLIEGVGATERFLVKIGMMRGFTTTAEQIATLTEETQKLQVTLNAIEAEGLTIDSIVNSALNIIGGGLQEKIDAKIRLIDRLQRSVMDAETEMLRFRTANQTQNLPKTVPELAQDTKELILKNAIIKEELRLQNQLNRAMANGNQEQIKAAKFELKRLPLIIQHTNEGQRLAKIQEATTISLVGYNGALQASMETHVGLSTALEDAKEKFDKFGDTIEDIIPMNDELLSAAQSLSSGFSNALADMLTSGKFNLGSLMDVFKSFVRQMIAKAIELFFVNKILGSLFGLPTTTFGSGATVLGTVPTTREAASGGAAYGRQPMMVGERGPELFVPHSAGSIMNGHNTRSAMGGGGGATVVQNINVTTGIQQTVRNEIRSMMPEIAANAKNAVADTKRRGGGFGRAFA